MIKRRLWIKKLHLAIALISALPILVMSLTGMGLVYKEAIDIYATQKYMTVETLPEKKSIDELRGLLNQRFPDKVYPGVILPPKEGQSYFYWIKDAPFWTVHYIDPYTGAFKGERAWEDWTLANIVWWLTDLHYSFKAGSIGSYIVGVSSLVFAVSILSGLFLWWPRKSQFDAGKFKLKRGKRWRQSAYNLHAVIGMYAALTLLTIALTGACITFWQPMTRFAHWITFSPPPKEAPHIPGEDGQSYLSSEDLIQRARTYLKATYNAEPLPQSIAFPDRTNIAVEISLQGNEGLGAVDHYHVWLNAVNGEILDAEAPPAFNRGQSLVAWISTIHYGTWGAYWGKIPELGSRLWWLFAAATPLFLMISGFTIVRKSFWKKAFGWFSRRFKRLGSKSP